MTSAPRLSDALVSVKCTGGCRKTFAVPLTPEQEAAWRGGALIQRVVPTLPSDERELLISGICPLCWEKLFGGEDDEGE
jgi:hypothetical protein